MAPDIDDPRQSNLAVVEKENGTSKALIGMGGPHARIKRPRIVIDEDEYVDSLSTIIERDYFPYVNELRLQKDFIEAAASGDEARAQECERELNAERLRNAQGRPAVSEFSATRQHTNSENNVDNDHDETQDGSAAIDTNMSLDAFQAKYTSEDNKSFNDLLDRQNAHSRAVYEWQWGKNQIEGPHAKHHQRAINYEERKLLKATQDENPEQLAWKDDRPSTINFALDKPRNDLFFLPEHGDLSPETLANQRSKQIHPENTRLPAPINKEGPSKAEIERAMRDFTHSEFETDDLGNPTVSGYTFVDEDDFTPSKPYRFDVKEEPSRDSVHRRLLERRQRRQDISGLNSKSKRWTPSTTGTPTSRRQAALTPAGKRLLSRFSKTPNTDKSSNFGDGFSPRPRVHLKSQKPPL